MAIRVFKRKAWTPNKNWPNGFEPFTTKGRTIKYVESEAEARAICLPHNATRPAKGAGRYNFVFYEWEYVGE